MNCFSPAANFMRICFFAPSIHVTAPSPNFLCVTVAPILTCPNFSSNAFFSASLSSLSFCLALTSAPLSTAAADFFLPQTFP